MRQFRELIRGFAGNKTVLLSTHILSEVEAVCDRVIIIRRGEKVADLAPRDSETSLEDVFAQLTADDSAEARS